MINKLLSLFISLMAAIAIWNLSSCAGTATEGEACDTTIAYEEDAILPGEAEGEPEEVIPDDLDEFVVTSQGGYGAYVRLRPSTDSEKLITYREGTTFTGAYTDVPHWIMIVEDDNIVGYIHDENVSYLEDINQEGGNMDEQTTHDETTRQPASQYTDQSNQPKTWQDYPWIQGNWMYSTVIYGNVHELRLGIHEDIITVVTDGQVDYVGPYKIRDNHIVYGNGIYFVIDTYSKRLKISDNGNDYMQRF